MNESADNDYTDPPLMTKADKSIAYMQSNSPKVKAERMMKSKVGQSIVERNSPVSLSMNNGKKKRESVKYRNTACLLGRLGH